MLWKGLMTAGRRHHHPRVLSSHRLTQQCPIHHVSRSSFEMVFIAFLISAIYLLDVVKCVFLSRPLRHTVIHKQVILLSTGAWDTGK